MWVSFTSANVSAVMSARELDTYQQTAGKQSDGTQESGTARIATIAANVCAQFRGIISANPSVIDLGPVGTIPDFAVGWAAAIARVSLVGLNPVQEGVTDPRRDEYRDAIKGRDSMSSMHPKAFALTVESSGMDAPIYGGEKLLNF